MKHLYIYLFFIILSIILFIYLIRYCKKVKQNGLHLNNEYFSNNNYSYHRCDDKMLGKIIDNIFKENNIEKSNENWNIYIPCGYNDVETELKTITINDKKSNKYIFGINGCDSIVSKNQIWESLVKCYGREHARTLMPESYVLHDPNEMQLFRKYFNPKKQEIYILKKNVQRKEGLKLTRDFFEIMDGAKENYRVAQKYLTDLFLINGRKVNLRVYLLIIIKDNYINFYVSKNGKCIYTNKKYNHDDFDFESNITSYHLDMSVYKENPRDFPDLKKYIDHATKKMGTGSELFKKIDHLMKDISICLANSVYQSDNIKGSVSFQLFGGDVIFTSDLHPYLLEFNKGPDMSARDEIDESMKKQVQSDIFRTLNIMQDDYDNSFYLIYRKKL